MKFDHLAWAALLYYYKSSTDRKYVKLFRDTEFISRLRERPWDVSYEEFERKVISGFISSIGLQLPGLKSEDDILAKIVELHPFISSIQGVHLLHCDLSSGQLLESLWQIYDTLSAIQGLWITGISKIAHVLNESLFVTVNISTLSHFGLLEGREDFIEWLRIAQRNAQEADEDFHNLGFNGSPQQFLSEKLGYANYDCQKSLARFIDEYFWLVVAENLPIPPTWLPWSSRLPVQPLSVQDPDVDSNSPGQD